MSTKTDAYWIMNALDLAASACENISNAGACPQCPLYGTCIDESDLTDVAYSFTVSKWDDFLALSDDVADYINESDAKADYEDQKRQIDIEEQMIDEKWGS